MEEARKRVTAEVEKSKKFMTPSMFEYEVKMKTHRLLADMDHYNKRAEKMKKANENREKDEIKKKKEEDAKQVEVEKKVQ